MEFKNYEYVETNADGVLILSEESEEDAEERLKRVVKFPNDWKLNRTTED